MLHKIVYAHTCQMTSKMQLVQNSVVMLRYCLMFTSTEKNNFSGKAMGKLFS